MKEKLNGLFDSIVAIRFYYPSRDRRFETLPFYLKKLRNFLRKHKGEACWLMGGIIERPAYLIFKKNLASEVAQLIKEELSEGGSFEMETVKDPTSIVMKYAKNERYVVGYLELPEINIKLGSPETLKEEIPVNYKEGFMLKSGNYLIQAENARLEIAPRKNSTTGETEYAPIIILENAIEKTIKNGKVIGEKHIENYGIWLELIDEKYIKNKTKTPFY